MKRTRMPDTEAAAIHLPKWSLSAVSNYNNNNDQKFNAYQSLQKYKMLAA
jgi:hypothetical protein